jgi:hypothetical protein
LLAVITYERWRGRFEKIARPPVLAVLTGAYAATEVGVPTHTCAAGSSRPFESRTKAISVTVGNTHGDASVLGSASAIRAVASVVPDTLISPRRARNPFFHATADHWPAGVLSNVTIPFASASFVLLRELKHTAAPAAGAMFDCVTVIITREP